MMRWFTRTFLDLLFPPKCIYCNSLVKSSQNLICPHCFNRLSWIKNEDVVLSGTFFSQCVSVAWYEAEIRKAFLQYKFYGKRNYAATFALPLAHAVSHHFTGRYDLISWIPTSKETFKKRGYDQAFLLADAIAKILQQNAVPLLTHPFPKKPQSTLTSSTARHQNVKGCFALKTAVGLNGKRILLIDDVITTGSTLEEAAKLLLSAGSKEVLCATFCRTRHF